MASGAISGTVGNLQTPLRGTPPPPPRIVDDLLPGEETPQVSNVTFTCLSDTQFTQLLGKISSSKNGEEDKKKANASDRKPTTRTDRITSAAKTAAAKAATKTAAATERAALNLLNQTWAEMSGLIPKKVKTAGYIALGSAIYAWPPVQALISWGGIPLVKAGAALGSAASFDTPQMVQVLLAYFGYEGIKEVLLGTPSKLPLSDQEKGGSKAIPIDTKKAVVYSLILLAAAQDEAIRSLILGLLTPTVIKTAAFCAAVDYVSLASKEDRWIPAAVTDTIKTSRKNISDNRDTITPVAIAGAISAALLNSPTLAVGLGAAVAAPSAIEWAKTANPFLVMSAVSSVVAMISDQPIAAAVMGTMSVAPSVYQKAKEGDKVTLATAAAALTAAILGNLPLAFALGTSKIAWDWVSPNKTS